MMYPAHIYPVLRAALPVEVVRYDIEDLDIYMSMMGTMELVRAITRVREQPEDLLKTAIRVVMERDIEMNPGLAQLFSDVNADRPAGRRLRLPVAPTALPGMPRGLTNVGAMVWWQAQEGMMVEVHEDEDTLVGWVGMSEDDYRNPLASSVAKGTTGHIVISSKPKRKDQRPTVVIVPTMSPMDLDLTERVLEGLRVVRAS